LEKIGKNRKKMEKIRKNWKKMEKSRKKKCPKVHKTTLKNGSKKILKKKVRISGLFHALCHNLISKNGSKKILKKKVEISGLFHAP
jgi:hypothetical protein